MLHQLYQKQVEAWKERFVTDIGSYQVIDDNFVSPKDLLSSRHKDTIELIEAEIERKRGMRKDIQRQDFDHPFIYDTDEGVAEKEGYNKCLDEDIAYLEEELRKLKNEQ